MDFEAMIRAAVNEGKSLEDIASEVGATLNKVQAETRTKVSERQMTLDKWNEIFNEHYEAGKLDLSDVAALATLVCEKEYPKWTADDLEGFHESVKTNIAHLAHLQGMSVGEILGEFMNEFSTKGKREEKPCDNCKNVPQPKSDRLKIQEFLKSL